LVTISPEVSAGEAVELMEKTGFSQLPVLDGGKPVGSIQEVTLARGLHDNSDTGQGTVGESMAKPLPTLDVNLHLDEADRLLVSGKSGVVALANGKVVDIVTRIDLIEYWSRQRKS